MAYWRIRMTYGPSGENLTSEIWQKGYIGIWYGAWTAKDLSATTPYTAGEAAKRLSRLRHQKALGWDKNLQGRHVEVMRKFANLTSDDWVFAYFDQTLHLGKVDSSPVTEIKSYARGGETFKARKINNRKSFALDSLPESFRLLSSAGRSTFHQVGATRVLGEMLAAANTSNEVIASYQKLDWREWLEVLGPKGWETLCLGYLIEQEDFLPTGVGVGGTLADFDIVGRTRSGLRVLAQCKKTPTTHVVSLEEKQAYVQVKHSHVYLFAYSGASGSPENVKVITGEDIEGWFSKKSVGKRYLQLLTS